MAIPFLIPQQDAENENHLIDQLIDQLYHILRQIIIRRGRTVDQPPVPAPRNRTSQQRRSISDLPVPHNVDITEQMAHRDLPLPDLVLSTGFNSSSAQCSGALAAPVPPPRRFVPAAVVDERPQPPPRRPRRRRTDKKQRGEEESIGSSQSETWQQMGKELRKIADEFKASNPQRQVGGREHNIKHKERGKSSFTSGACTI